MQKSAVVTGVILFFVGCVAIGFYLPSSIALPAAIGLAIVSTVIARSQKRHKKAPEDKADTDEA